jgi:hypothetical protein
MSFFLDMARRLKAPSMQDGTIYNVKVAFGWVSNTENFLKAMEH